MIPAMCTGSYIEKVKNETRPPPGTSCIGPCWLQSGSWGSSFCYTSEDWGAECVPCSGMMFRNISIVLAMKYYQYFQTAI